MYTAVIRDKRVREKTIHETFRNWIVRNASSVKEEYLNISKRLRMS